MKWQGREIGSFRQIRSSGYSDRLVQLLVAQASSVTETNPLRTAALETAAGIWGRSFASVQVKPETASQVLTPSVLNLIGRELIRTGEILFRIQVVNGRRVLSQASSWDVLGGTSPESWRFNTVFSGPDTEEEAILGWDETVFLTWATEPNRPYKGLGPLQLADLTGAYAEPWRRAWPMRAAHHTAS